MFHLFFYLKFEMCFSIDFAITMFLQDMIRKCFTWLQFPVGSINANLKHSLLSICQPYVSRAVFLPSKKAYAFSYR